MNSHSGKADPLLLPDNENRVTSRLFEAYLACPTKCYLLSIGEAVTGNDFTIWKEKRSEAYRLAGIQRLSASRKYT